MKLYGILSQNMSLFAPHRLNWYPLVDIECNTYPNLYNYSLSRQNVYRELWTIITCENYPFSHILSFMKIKWVFFLNDKNFDLRDWKISTIFSLIVLYSYRCFLFAFILLYEFFTSFLLVPLIGFLLEN